MLLNARNQTPEPPSGGGDSSYITTTGDEDVYNFIKRERASQKDLLNTSQQNLKRRSKSNSINHSQELAKKPNYIEAVKQEIHHHHQLMLSKDIRGGPMVQSQ